MEPTIHVQPGPAQVENEGFLHYLAREGRVALRWIIGISLIATLAVMVSPFLFLAPIPALVLLVSYVLFMLTREVERRADPVADQAFALRENAGESEVMENASEMQQVHPDTMHIVKREGVTGVAILAGVMVIALLIACFTLPWEVVAIGAFVVTAYMLLVAAPVLLGWIEDDIEIVNARRAGRGGEAVETHQPVTADDRTIPAT
jgi:hypothetical protein